MKCHKCGAENPNHFKFCGQCGEPLELHCPQCGTLIPEGAMFCPGCGHKMQVVEEKIFEVINHTDEVLSYTLDGENYVLKPNEKIVIKTHPEERHSLIAHRGLIGRNVVEFTGLREGKYHYIKGRLGSLPIKKM